MFPCSSGARATAKQERRDRLNKYLKATPLGRQKINNSSTEEEKDELQHFDKVLNVLTNHRMHCNKYVFALICCFRPGCPHPVCMARTGCDRGEILWYPGGPSMLFFPWPVLDEDIDPGKCTKCKAACTGHFMGLTKLLERHTQGVATNPNDHLPSENIAKVYDERRKATGDATQAIPDEALQQEIAAKLCLGQNIVSHTFQHLCQVAKNRQRGAQKAAATRAANRQANANI